MKVANDTSPEDKYILEELPGRILIIDKNDENLYTTPSEIIEELHTEYKNILDKNKDGDNIIALEGLLCSININNTEMKIVIETVREIIDLYTLMELISRKELIESDNTDEFTGETIDMVFSKQYSKMEVLLYNKLVNFGLLKDDDMEINYILVYPLCELTKDTLKLKMGE